MVVLPGRGKRKEAAGLWLRAENIKYGGRHMNYTGPKVRLSRKQGVALTPKAERIMQKRSQPPGQHGGNQRRNKVSVYKRQLVEKQLLRHYYNIQEKQLRKTYKRAAKIPGNTADALVGLLETRLDAVVTRGGLARTVYAARQYISHGHLEVNGQKVDVPSYQVKEGDVITVREKSRKAKCFAEALETAVNQPSYVELDKEKMSVKLVHVPKPDEVPVVQNGDVSLVVEYYAR